MNFSNTIKYSGLSSFSPNSSYLAIAKSKSLIIYSTSDLKHFIKYTFPSNISLISFSPDSSLILSAFYKSGIIEIRSVTNTTNFSCTITETSNGVSYALFTPDSRKIIIANDFNVRLSIKSLIDKSTVYINYPKYADKGISFSSTGYFMALIERRDNKDYIGVYFTGDWSLVSHFQCESFDLQDICWSKDDTSIICYDSELECKMLVYSPTGNLIAMHEPYTTGLGITKGILSNNGKILAVGYYDNKVRLYNPYTWKMISELNHNMISVTMNDMANVFKEEEINNAILGKTTVNNVNKGSGSSGGYSKYVEKPIPYKFQLSNTNGIVKGVGGAITEMKFSFDSKFLATTCECVGNVVFIWEINGLHLYTVVQQIKNVKCFDWSPVENMLLIVTENAKLYTFTLNNVYIVELVSDLNNNFGAIKVMWNKDGKSFIVSDKKQMIIGHPDIGEDIEGDGDGDGEGGYGVSSSNIDDEGVINEEDVNVMNDNVDVIEEEEEPQMHEQQQQIVQ